MNDPQSANDNQQPSVEALLNLLRPVPCKARMAHVLARLFERTRDEWSTAGEVRAHRTNTKLGNNVAGNLPSTFVAWVSEQTGLYEDRVRDALAWGQLPPDVLDYIADAKNGDGEPLFPRHGQGKLLDRLHRRASKGATPADLMAVVKAELAVPVPEADLEATGAVFHRPGITLLCADSFAKMDRQAKHGVRFDCILVDPPYGIAYDGGGAGLIAGDEDPHKAAAEFVPRMAALLKPGRALCIWASEKTAFIWVKAITRAGLSVHEIIDWDKVEPWFKNRAKEVLIVASKGELQVFNDDRETTWSHRTVRDERRDEHSTPKPPELMHHPILKYTQPGDVVFDPCAGLAPVGEACIELGRRYTGIEVKDRHFTDATKHLEQAFAQNELRKAA